MEAVGKTIVNQLKVMLLVAIITLIGQRVGYGIGIVKAIPGMVIILVLGMAALIIKDFTPKLQFPAFAWASLLALILTMPFMPTAKFLLTYTNEVSFMGTTTPILAFAGISVGMKVTKLKELSWKLIVVAIFVFLGTFFGSAVVAQIILKIQGLI